MTGITWALFYQSNSVISDFSICDSKTLDRTHSTCCIHMYAREFQSSNFMMLCVK